MNLLGLSWKNIKSEPLSTMLSLILFALGVGLISLLLLMNKQIDNQFEKNLAGVNLVVGAKGSPMQLILSSIYHIDFPTGNISIKEANMLRRNPLVKSMIPLAMGDSYKMFRIIGSNHDYPKLYEMELEEGRLWQSDFEVTIGRRVADALGLKVGDSFVSAHGFGEAIMNHEDHPFKVVGIFKKKKRVLDQLILCNIESVWKSHDHSPPPKSTPKAPEKDKHDHKDGKHDHKGHDHGSHEGHDHNHEGHDHDGHDHDGHDHGSHDGHDHEETPKPANFWDNDETKEVTSLLVFYRNPIAAVKLPRFVNDRTDMQAAAPAFEIARLSEMMGVGQQALRWLALVIIFVSGLSVFISLFNSLKKRRYELAIMRVMGGSRTKLFLLLILEGLIIAVLGYLLGIVLSHVAMEVLARYMQESYQYEFSGKVFLKEEWWLLAGALFVGLLAAILPAINASSTDISKTLSK